jgi:uncharacterized protein
MHLPRFLLFAVILCCQRQLACAFLQPCTALPSLSSKSATSGIRKGGCDLPFPLQTSGRHNIGICLPLLTTTKADFEGADAETRDAFFDGRTTALLIGGQSLLIFGSIVAAAIVGTPVYGLGPGFAVNWASVSTGVLLTLPLGVLAGLLDLVEDRFPALQDVSTATQRSVLALLGGEFKPVIAITTSLALGCVAGLGEEMLFRGVFQYELASRFGQTIAIAASSLIFGALHAVTPLYALLATLASVYFGAIYVWSSNLAVPIVTHAFYDLVALLFAHWTVSRLSVKEQQSLSEWKGPGDDI